MLHKFTLHQFKIHRKKNKDDRIQKNAKLQKLDFYSIFRIYDLGEVELHFFYA